MTSLPKLTRPEMARLIEIGPGLGASCGASPAITKRLIEKGLARAIGGRFARTGRVMEHPHVRLTDAGRAVLAGLPGEATS